MAEDITTLLVRYKTETLAIKEAELATDKLAKEIAQTEVDMSKLDDEQKKTYNSIIKNTKKAKNEQIGLTDSIKSMAAGYLSFHTITQAVKQFADFDDALKRTQALTGANTKQSEELEKQARDLGATTAFTASQVATAQGNMAQAGLKVNQILEATPGILNLASAGQIDLASATDMTISALNIFGLEASKSTHVADLLAAAQANSTGDTHWFSMALQNAGATAKSLNFSLENTLSVLGAMSASYADGGSAGTALNAILRDLNKSMKGQEYIILRGKKVRVAQNGEMLSFSKIIGNTNKALQGLTATQKYQALATNFGDESIRGFLKLLDGGVDQIEKYDKIMDNAAGTASLMAKIMESGVGGALRELGSSIESVVLQLVTTFEPAVMGVSKAFSWFLTNTTQILEVINKYDVLQSVAAGFLTAAGAVKVLTGAMTLLGIASSATPLGAIAAIAGLVVAGGTYLYKKFNKPEETATNNVPKYALGTNDAKGGLSLVGERGPELVNIPQGSQVVPTEKTKELLSQRNTVSGDNINITINSTGADIDDIIDKLTDFFDQRERRSIARTRIMLGGA